MSAERILCGLRYCMLFLEMTNKTQHKAEEVLGSNFCVGNFCKAL